MEHDKEQNNFMKKERARGMSDYFFTTLQHYRRHQSEGTE